MIGGAATAPKPLRLDTMVIAGPAGSPPSGPAGSPASGATDAPASRPAMENTTGMTRASPMPSVANPPTATTGFPMTRAAANPPPANVSDHRTTRKPPHRATKASPRNRPAAIARQYAAKPDAAKPELAPRL